MRSVLQERRREQPGATQHLRTLSICIHPSIYPSIYVSIFEAPARIRTAQFIKITDNILTLRCVTTHLGKHGAFIASN